MSRERRDRVEVVQAIGDPAARIRAAIEQRHAVYDEMQAELDELGAVIATAIKDAKENDVTQGELAEQVGVSRQRLWQLTKSGSPR